MMRIDPGAIGFTQEHKYSTVGEQITVEAIDRKANNYEIIQA